MTPRIKDSYRTLVSLDVRPGEMDEVEIRILKAAVCMESFNLKCEDIMRLVAELNKYRIKWEDRRNETENRSNKR